MTSRDADREREPLLEERSDADLILLAREGDGDAIAELFRRHYPAGVHFAIALTSVDEGPDLASEAFSRVMAALSRGYGPVGSFRPYLITSIKNTKIELFRRHGRQERPVPDFVGTRVEPVISDGVDDRIEASVISRAFNTLPTPWQTVLWFGVVEGESMPDIGNRLGINPNAASAMTFRAREGLRRAYLAEHVVTADAECRGHADALPRYVRGDLGPRKRVALEEHLEGCRRCTRALADLRSLNTNLGALLVPALVGSGLPAPSAAPAAATAAAAATVTLVVAVVAAAAGVLFLLHPGGVGTGASQPTAAPTLDAQHDQKPVPAPVPRPRAHATKPPATRTVDGSIAFESEAGLPTSEPWRHVVFRVSSQPAAMVLTATITGSGKLHVHQDLPYGYWTCSRREVRGRRTVRLRCELAPQVGRGNDFALDVEGQRPAVSVEVAPAYGTDRDPGNNRARWIAKPLPLGQL